MALQPPPTKALNGLVNLFKGVKYYVAPCIPFEERENLSTMLNTHGATEVKSIRDAMYIFTDSEGFEGANEVSFDASLVMPQWVGRSLSNKTLQDVKYFSPSPRAIFSTLVIATDQLPPGDVEAVVAGVHARGGMYREGLTRDVTHLLVLGPTGDKYATARKYADQTGIKIVMVHWFDDCCRVGQRVSETTYEQVLIDADEEIKNGGKSEPMDTPAKKKRKAKLSKKARLIYASIMKGQTPPRVDVNSPLPPSSPPKIPATSSTIFASSSPVKSNKVKSYVDHPPPEQDLWNNRRILLSRSLMLTNDRRKMVETEVRRFGGDIVDISSHKGAVGTSVADEEGDEPEEDELDSDSDAEEEMQYEIDLAEQRANGGSIPISSKYKQKDAQEALLIMEGQVDILVTKYRSGLGYMAALEADSNGRRDVTIGTIPWLFFCHDSGSISPPTAQLLHFPVRRGFVKGIRGKQITISNYQGQARDYLKKLITVMAGPLPAKGPEVFTATLCRSTDYVIAGKMEGQKVERAAAWKLPIVNHLWLEDTFRDWQLASLTVAKYVHWSDNLSYTELLPNCPIYRGNPSKSATGHLRKELDAVEAEMADIGYDTNQMHHVRSFDLESLRRLLEHSPFAMLLDEPSASHMKVERDLMDDEDIVMDNADDGVSPFKHTGRSRTTSKSPVKAASRANGNSSAPNRSPVKEETDAYPEKMKHYTEEIRREVMEGFNQHSGTEISPSKSGQPLRSPFDPVPKRKKGPLVTNDTPPQPRKTSGKEPQIRKPREMKEKSRGRNDDDEEEEVTGKKGRPSIDLETKEQAMARSKRNKGKVLEEELERSPSPRKRRPRSEQQSHSPSPDEVNPPPSSTTSPPSSSRADKTVVAQVREKKTKRDIRTQDSDEEFPVESVGNLMTRRAKVVATGQGVKGTTKTGNTEGKDQVDIKRRRSSATNRQEDESDEEDWSDQKDAKPVSSKANKVMKRLRDSISGKEDGKNSPKRKGRQSATVDEDRKPASAKAKTGRKPTRPQSPIDSDDDSEASDQEQNKPTRAKPTANRAKSAKAIPQPKVESPSSLSSPESDQEEEDSDNRRRSRRPSTSASVADNQSEGGNTRARRGAATKATQLLHDKIMPDANRFATEFRTGAIRGDWEDSKKRKRDGNEEDENKKRRKSMGDLDGKKATTSTAKRAESIPKTGIRMATTKVQLTDDELNKLRRMGIHPVDDPRTCTHLVANSILRTEKFICAISAAPMIVREKWVRDCLNKGKILDASEYQLWDTDGEKRFGVDLQQTLLRARKTGTRLFDGHMFYLSPNLTGIVYETLKNAIDSAGGKSTKGYPNPRLLEGHLEDKHFIGAANEKPKHKGLVEKGIPIYSQELILRSILRQELPEWDSDEVLLE